MVDIEKEVELSKEETESDNGSENTELQEIKLQLEEYTNLLKRSQADFINYKNRISKDTQDIIFVNTKNIALEFIGIKDVLQLAKDNEVHEETKKVLDILLEKVNNSLKRLNITKIELKDDVIDYNLCECVNVVPTKNKNENNKIIQIIEDGYLMNEKLIKPTKVIISKLEE